MKRKDKLIESLNNYLFDHFHLKDFLHNSFGFLVAVLSAFIFAFGFCSFISPHPTSGSESFKIITGGVSGLSQNVAKIVEICGGQLSDSVIEALGYTVFNLPLLILAFLFIGKRFTILSAVNVVAASLFIYFMPQWGDFTKAIGQNPFIVNSHVARTIFAGLCTGVSSALTFKAEISSGGIDIVSYYYALKKSTTVGKYATLINGCIVTTFGLLLIIKNPSSWDSAIVTVLYSVIYLFICMLVIDAINIRNKKLQIQFITAKEDFASILLAHFPHGSTITKGIGAYSLKEKEIIYMVCSPFELKRIIALAKKIDPHIFISVTSLVQVYGNFFIKPIR